MSASLTAASPGRRANADRIGVIASTLCAIHCAVTPFLLIALPSFGKIWSHPASHWGMALIVVPVAVGMMTAGYRRHRRKWIIATGALGIALVVAGAIVPYLEKTPAPASEESEVFTWSVGEELPGGEAETDEPFVWVAGEELPEASCDDNCCPSFWTDGDGKLRLHIPTASIVTTLGGLALIVTHMGNLCCCSGCRRGRRSDL